MRKYRLALFSALLLIGFFLAAGCAGPSRVEMDFGTSVKLARINQILNPDAEKNLNPVYGMDGQAVQNALNRYRKDFEKPPAAPTYILGITPGQR
jgi:hypothetical protein